MADVPKAGTTLDAAFEWADRWGHRTVEPIHILAALAAEPSDAQAVLVGLGITASSIADALATLAEQRRAARERARRDGPAEEPFPFRERAEYDDVTVRTVTVGPALDRCWGHAEGLALGYGSPTVEPLHWLLALLYSHDSPGRELDALGVTGGGIVTELRRRGLPTPGAEPPVHRPYRSAQSAVVTKDEFDRLRRLLSDRHRDGGARVAHRALGPSGELVSVSAEDGIDLRALVAEARSAAADRPALASAEPKRAPKDRGVLAAATTEALRWRNAVSSDVHVLLALAARPSGAQDALAELGITSHALQDALAALAGREHLAHPELGHPEDLPVGAAGGTERDGVAVGPALGRCWGRATGLSLALGSPGPTAEHWLLATLYGHPVAAPHAVLHHLGVAPVEIAAGLRRRGIRAPAFDPPAARPWSQRQAVLLAPAECGSLLGLLEARHGHGTDVRWAFRWYGHLGGPVWVTARDGIDLPGLLAEIRSGLTTASGEA